MCNASSRGYLLFSLIDLFQYFKAFLHPVVFMTIHEDGNATTSLRQYNRPTGCMELPDKCRDPCTKFR